MSEPGGQAGPGEPKARQWCPSINIVPMPEMSVHRENPVEEISVSGAQRFHYSADKNYQPPEKYRNKMHTPPALGQ